MSLEAISWALRDAPDVTPQLVAVLTGLAEHADKRGCGAYPSMPTLARYARKSERQVRYDVRVLEALGVIRRGDQSLASRVPANRRPVVYDLALERVRAAEPQEAGDASGVQPTAAQLGGQPIAGQPTAPQETPDQPEHPEGQSAAPLGDLVLGGNAAQPGGQSIAGKPYMNLKSKTLSRRSRNDGRDDVLRLCVHLADRIESNTGERPSFSTRWLDAARLLIDNDHRTEKQIHTAIDWCQDHQFWASVILSMPKLREQYPQLRAQAQRANGTPLNGSSPGRQVSPRQEHRLRR